MKRENLRGLPADVQEYGTSLWFLLKWMFVSVCVGLVVGSVSSLFGHTLIFANQIRAENPWVI